MQEVKTFGFRGEALASLCCISNLTITTRTNDQKLASKLTFDKAGRFMGFAPCARGVGTTVSIGGIFKPLPVRYKVGIILTGQKF